MADDFEFPCCVEYAKSDRSRCVKCGSQILKAEVRIGQQYDRDHSSYRWYHLDCFQYARNFPKTAKTAEEFLFGYENISSIDRKRVSRAIEKAVFHRDNGGSSAGYNEQHELDDDDDEKVTKAKAPKKAAIVPKKTYSLKEFAYPTSSFGAGKKIEKEKQETEKEKEIEVVAIDPYGFSSSSTTPSYLPPSTSLGFVDLSSTAAPIMNYGIPDITTVSPAAILSDDPFIGFDTKPCGFSFNDDKENINNNRFHNAQQPQQQQQHLQHHHQSFASSPLKTGYSPAAFASATQSSVSSSSSEVSSFLSGFTHRLARSQVEWLLRPPAQHQDKVRRAVEAARVLYGFDQDEDDLVDTLERIYQTCTVGGW